ncbi:16S rRNA (uracil(1498)-N(3))-methyltransferase [Amaricoccus macauensis]|uniref:16S rRNA (uracil(1498)-N(3))-methyltransferase n=1 Tax=Amaricoccus macauensis TaxID=57001 RepID=UPI003C7DBFBB
MFVSIMWGFMSETRSKIRLFVRSNLATDGICELTPDHAHYLYNVMRQREGAQVGLFNGRDGEWRAEIISINKNRCSLAVIVQTAPQGIPPDLWLLFAPIKKTRTDFIVEKAAELGCSRIRPIFTRNTNSERLRIDRLQAHAIEAAEQCGETSIAQVDPPMKLRDVFEGWNVDRRLMFCDESRDAPPAQVALRNADHGSWAILIGPEGGFSQAEAEQIRSLPFVQPVTLGPRVLRADTAAVSAITLWQAFLGDWL